MPFTPIVRTDKHRASTYNSRFEEIEFSLGLLPSLARIVGWTDVSGLNEISIAGIASTYEALLFTCLLHDGNTLLTFNDVVPFDPNSLYSRRIMLNNGTTGFDTNNGGVSLEVAASTAVHQCPTTLWVTNIQGAVKHWHMSNAAVRDAGSGLGDFRQTGGLCIDPGAITRINVLNTGDPWSTGSGYALYGLRG